MDGDIKIYKSHKVTIRDIAEMLDLSTATVSMTLAGKGRISAEVRDRILTTAKEMGYQSNKSGCVLGMKSITIGIFIPRTPEAVQMHIKRGIEAACRRNSDLKLTCMLAEYDYGTEEELESLSRLAEVCDGLVVELDADREGLHAAAITMANRRGIPIVSLVVRSRALRTRLHVAVDGSSAGGVAADLLYLGLRMHPTREVMMMSGVPDVDIHNENYRGFAKRCATLGLHVVAHVPTFDKTERVRALLEETFAAHPGIAGIYVSSYLASAVVEGLSAMGRDRDVLVVGTDMTADNIAALNAADTPLCAVIDQLQALQAERAMDHLLDLILCNRPDDEIGDEEIPPRVILGSLSSAYRSFE